MIKNPKDILANYLLKSSYDIQDLDHIRQFMQDHDTLIFHIKENGLYAAAEDASPESGMANTWIRDTIMITHYHQEIGEYRIAKKTIATLRDYFLKYWKRFVSIIEGKADKNDFMQRPHVRFNGDTLEEIDEYWNHAQNDALGYALWMTFKLANKGLYQFDTSDYMVFSLFPFYFEAIAYWQDKDSGHWEEEPKTESSSIGAVVAGLTEMREYIQNHKDHRFVYGEKRVSIFQLDKLIHAGRFQLDKFLPFESPGLRDADAALLFLIYPLEIVSENQQKKIMDLVLSKLKGAYGIKRYEGDSYFCADYDEHRTEVVHGEAQKERDNLLKPGSEAQWCIFDPIVSVIYGKEYLAAKKRNSSTINELLRYQIHYFNRSLLQLTPEGKCAECYYLKNFAKGIYVPNPHTPLGWTQANLGLSIKYMEASVRMT